MRSRVSSVPLPEKAQEPVVRHEHRTQSRLSGPQPIERTASLFPAGLQIDPDQAGTVQILGAGNGVRSAVH